MASTSQSQSAFERSLEDFKKTLKKRDQNNFRMTTLSELHQCIGDLQNKQNSKRRLQNLNRLKPFLEAIEQFGKVVEIFCNSSDIVPFVWGPIKFLLQVASTYADAFSELLDTYEHIGENLPLLLQYQDLFRTKPHMVRVLSLMYEDILNFHRVALRYFHQPLWRQLFDATWKTYKTRFSGIISSMGRHRNLIDSQASLSQIEDFQKSREIEDLRFNEQMGNESRRQLQAVYNWLRATDVETDQYHNSKTRANYAGTGKWLLQNKHFKDWFDPQFATIPPLLWLNGIPGAGKTILASLVVEEALKLIPPPTVLFFYCRHNNPERDSFSAIARSFLNQFLKQDRDLLPYFYQQCCENGEAVLTSPDAIESLLSLAFNNCKNAYIILDGIDECSRDQRKTIVQWFRKLVENLPTTEPDRLRCLFVSQEDGPARKDFNGLATISIKPEDSEDDVKEYCRLEADQLKQTFQLSDERANTILLKVTERVKGMFLLAKLIWINLSAQTSVAGLENELEPNVFPEKLSDAYRRIMVRIKEQPIKTRVDEALMLLEWLVLSKRPLKWQEIQILKAINLENRSVDFERQRFLVDAKDLCESLVEIRSDDTIELVHLTARLFLVDDGHVDAVAGEMKMACLCIDYLNLPSFLSPPTENSIHRGDFGFLNYAVLYWLRHLEVGIIQAESQDEHVQQLAESLEIFVDNHWSSPTALFQVSKRNKERLRFFQHLVAYEKLEQAVVSTRKQLRDFGQMKKEEIALDLSDVVKNARDMLERIVSAPMDRSVKKGLRERYGDRFYKCPRLSCQFFTVGFESAGERDGHIAKHERPYRCSDEKCTGYVFGFSSDKERLKHMLVVHPKKNEVFPTDQEIQQSLRATSPAKVPDQEQEKQQQSPQEISSSDTEPEPPRLPPQKRQRQTEFKCEHCEKVFKKRYNLQSHLLTHGSNLGFECNVCKKRFARKNDCNRHMNSKHGQKQYFCGGILNDGRHWGCGKTFARQDTLNAHQRTKTGQMCLRPLKEQENQGP